MTFFLAAIITFTCLAFNVENQRDVKEYECRGCWKFIVGKGKFMGI